MVFTLLFWSIQYIWWNMEVVSEIKSRPEKWSGDLFLLKMVVLLGQNHLVLKLSVLHTELQDWLHLSFYFIFQVSWRWVKCRTSVLSIIKNAQCTSPTNRFYVFMCTKRQCHLHLNVVRLRYSTELLAIKTKAQVICRTLSHQHHQQGDQMPACPVDRTSSMPPVEILQHAPKGGMWRRSSPWVSLI